MAYRRSLTIRGTFFTRQSHPSLSYILHDDDGERQSSQAESSQSTINKFLQRGYCSGHTRSATLGFGAFSRERGPFFPPSMGLGSSLCNYSSSAIGEGSDKIEYMSDVVEVLSDKTMEVAVSQTPAVSEVAIAAVDSFYPVAYLQHLIDGVHSFTGLGWWASIVLTTIIIRTVTVPLLVHQLKCTTKLTLMRPHLEDIKVEMQNRGMDSEAVAEGQKKMKALFREYGVTPFTPLKGLFLQGPIFISFFFAINNMVEKVPSLKEGGAYWFTDLTTPDSLYIFPILTALTFLITVECNMQEGLEGNPIAGTMKKVSRIFAVLTVPLTISFPKAIFCYWITSNLYSLAYGLVIKRPDVKNLLGVPIIPAEPTATKPQAAPSLFSSASVMQKPYSPFTGLSQPTDSSSVISEKLKNLEEQVKSRNKDDQS